MKIQKFSFKDYFEETNNLFPRIALEKQETDELDMEDMGLENLTLENLWILLYPDRIIAGYKSYAHIFQFEEELTTTEIERYREMKDAKVVNPEILLKRTLFNKYFTGEEIKKLLILFSEISAK